jgi:hypothetical protein
MGCGQLKAGMPRPGCEDIPVPGNVPEVYAGNLSDLESVTYASDGSITDFTMAAGTGLFKFEGFKNDYLSMESIVAPEVGPNQFSHMFRLVVVSRDQAAKNIVGDLARGRFFFINEQRGKGADAFEMRGVGVGLQANEEQVRASNENGGFYILEMSTDEEEFEKALPPTVFDTDYATTKALLESKLAGSS